MLPPTAAVSLRRLFPAASFVGCADIRVTAACSSSEECRPGALFAVNRGVRFDGHAFIADALRRGASALLVERPQPDAGVPQCVVPDVRRAYAELCSALEGSPSRELRLAGVTGTNGKTTITWLIRALLQNAGHRTGLLGTIEYHDGLHGEPASLTTPDSRTLATWLAAMAKRRTTHAAMELSSHALAQHRTAGTELDVAIISNITQDHFDYHLDFEHYRASKLRILEHLKPTGVAVINIDDAGSRSCLPHSPGAVLTYGFQQGADITADVLEESLGGSIFRLLTPNGSIDVRTSLIGRHNISNCLAAAAAGLHFGLSLEQIAAGLESLHSVPGRMEPVECGQPYAVFVDYAHTEDALERAIVALRRLTVGRVLCVFGAGGDRDRTKRPGMGRAAAEADIAILTSDNPRSEDPEQIMREILAGFPAEAHPELEADREQAICRALELARPGDSVLIAGKGHETEQICGAERRRFDDRAVARKHINAPVFLRRPSLRQVHVEL
ncbi:MAG TPA: UDP-N-acetylmuramoyl-L-alanyl-D-glutamate--2,6-diaminopimelate ligase [Planctomycetaceae bacterium]|nr:UDP-N-acetylmuramoyl-L-alanyl-D-glutamate--2,6-diaminopimelate ligase [Planctomycetaceae bacterium]